MDSVVVISGTDEDDLVDIEGDSDEGTADDEQLHVTETRDVTDNVNTSSELDDSDTPFTRNSLQKATKTVTSQCNVEKEFTDWWKSASEFQRPVENYDENVEVGSTNNELNPILQRPAQQDVNPFDEDEKIYDDNGELFEPPDKEITLPPSDVTEEERERFPEFFSGRTRYSPHNYITIRDTILKLWNEKKPGHVNKVILRPILKKTSGNVNNIGKIHKYLETIGAINFGSNLVWWKCRRRKVPIYRPPRTPLDTDYKLKRALEQRMSGRNRKRPISYTPELKLTNSIGGYTIDHVNNNAIHVTKVPKKDTRVVPKKHSLTRCKEFPSVKDSPYDIIVDAAALIVMDVHSHLSTHEVMGLIGGFVSNGDDGRVKVQIVCARPCKSAASSRHCEMDPVSQSSVCDWIALRGMKVVGWYHSHPTFPPQPSEVDISTQTEMQSMFDAHDSVFVGVILTPYLKHKLRTTVNFIHVDREGTPFTIPYRIQPDTLIYGSQNYVDLTSTLRKMATAATHARAKGSSRLPHLLDPVVQASTVTHLDKLIRSLTSHITAGGSTQRTSTSKEDEITTQTDIVTSTSSRIMTSSLHSDDDADDETYSINQNFPSLADNGLVYQDSCDVVDDVIASDVCVRSTVTANSDTECWNDIFDELKSILLKASEHALVK